jgi:hypothetical protein
MRSNKQPKKQGDRKGEFNFIVDALPPMYEKAFNNCLIQLQLDYSHDPQWTMWLQGGVHKLLSLDSHAIQNRLVVMQTLHPTPGHYQPSKYQ